MIRMASNVEDSVLARAKVLKNLEELLTNLKNQEPGT